jgi:pimeloyl-ACP methyl ester carboxylesterase
MMSQSETRNSTYQIPYSGTIVNLTVQDLGEGRPFLLLHGGAGPASMFGFGKLLVERKGARVITPTHPGFMRTSRPEVLNSVKGLAQVYSGLLDQLDVNDVTVVGNSVGGWIASELALLSPPRVSNIVLVDAPGIEVPDHPMTDISKLTPEELTRHSYYNPEKYLFDPSKLSDEQRAVIAGNRAALIAYCGPQMVDRTLAQRLEKITIPTLVIWGESDRIVDPAYGRALAAAIPGAKFILLPQTGHLPQIETPELLVDAIWKNTKN